MSKRKWYDFGGDVSRDLFSKGGSALGSLIPVTGASEVGSYLGSLVGTYFHKLTGIGDYSGGGLPSMRQNSLMGIGVGGSVSGSGAYVFGSGDNFVLSKNEFVSDIKGSTGFVNHTFICQPGNATSYQWASGIAPYFEQWVPMGEVWYFKPTCGTAVSSNNPAMGSVIMTAEYNVNSAPFEDKSEMLNNVWTVSGPPYQQLVLPIECSPLERPDNIFFVRTGNAVAADDSTKWYDLANIQIATEGMQIDGAVIGELWHSYMLCFKKPQQPRNLPSVPSWGFSNISAGGTMPLGPTSGADFLSFNNRMPGCTVDMPNQQLVFSRSSDGVYLVELLFEQGGAVAYPTCGFTGSLGTDVGTYADLSQTTGVTGFNTIYRIYVAIDGTVPLKKTLTFASANSSVFAGGELFATVTQVSDKVLGITN